MQYSFIQLFIRCPCCCTLSSTNEEKTEKLFIIKRMNRPLSAPGYVPSPSPSREEEEGEEEVEKGVGDIVPTTTQLLFSEIEERATQAQADNRGHKLPLEDLPSYRGGIIPKPSILPPNEDEFDVQSLTFNNEGSYTITCRRWRWPLQVGSIIISRPIQLD